MHVHHGSVQHFGVFVMLWGKYEADESKGEKKVKRMDYSALHPVLK